MGLTGFLQKLDAWHIYDHKTSLYYIVKRVKEFTMEMAAKNSTPFLHQNLYRSYTPQCIVSVNDRLFQFFRSSVLFIFEDRKLP